MSLKEIKYFKNRSTFLIISIIIVGFTIYINSLNGKFLWDDKILVEDNIYIRSFLNIPKIFTEDIGGGATREFNFYRPLQMLTYTIDYSLWKLNVIGYHLTNIILHILVALAIYWLVGVLYNDKFLSFLTAILFIAHPIHTDAISYISGRTDSLSTLFILLCFVFYIRHLNLKRISIYILMLLSYILALLSRENSLILPVLLLLYHWAFKKKFEVKKFFPILAITFGYILLRLTVLSSLLPHPSYPALSQRVLGFFDAITNYSRLLLLPFNLHMLYEYKLLNFSHPTVILGAIILLLLLIYAFKKRKTDSLIFFSVYWFFIALLPVSNLYPINAHMAEHWLYLPSIGFFLILAKGLNSIYKSKEFQTVLAVLIISILVFYSFLTIKQNNYWREPIAFYKRTLKYAPRSLKAYNNLGVEYANIGKHKEAIESFKKALEINPKDAYAYYNLGNAYKAIGENEESIASYKNSIAINPNDPGAYNNLGNAYKAIGKNEEAIFSFKKALELNPNFANAHYNLGNVYNATGEYGKAIVSYKKALELTPSDIDIHYNLGNTYIAIGKYEDAISSYQKALQINPKFARAHNNLAVAYYYVKRYDLAIHHYNRSIELGNKPNPEFLKLLTPYRQ